MKKVTNPIVSSVIETYETVQTMTEMFLTNTESVSRGLLISGDAGMGKTEFVNRGIKATNSQHRVQYIKGSSITAAAMFCLLYESREKGQVIVFDDTDLIHKSAQEVATILDMLKGATEPTMGERTLSWMRANANPLMIQNNVPMSFDFQGAIIWITNDRIEDMRKKAKGHWNAISSRFTQVEAWFEDHEKIAYTLYLIEEVKMLGKNCTVKKGGYKKEVVEDTLDYMHTNYRQLKDITPRVAIKIADIRMTYPDKWKVYCDNQFINNNN